MYAVYTVAIARRILEVPPTDPRAVHCGGGRRLFRQAADLLRCLQHEQRELAKDVRLRGRVVKEANRATFVTEVVVQHRFRAGRERGVLGGRFAQVFLDRARPQELRVAQLQRAAAEAGAAVALHTSFFVDEQRQLCARAAAAALHDEKVGRLDPAAAGERDRGERRDGERCPREPWPSDAAEPHALTATPPRRGSPAPVN